jgi:hypothetical protein
MNQQQAGDFTSGRQRRLLWWIPIIHTQEDMGTLKGSVENVFVQRFGKARWEAHRRTVVELWQDVRALIEHASFQYDTVRLYQDGLPVCGKETEIVRDLAREGSANHQLLADLIDKGATLTGTESPQLLLEEYELNRQILSDQNKRRPPPRQSSELNRRARTLLERRDQFIASRIDQTLQPGEHGLLFLGMLHSIDRSLPADIQLVIQKPNATHRLPSTESRQA